MLAPWRVAADTLLLVAAAALGAWGHATGLWVWTALCLVWAGDVLALSPLVRLRDAGRLAHLAAPVALLAGLARVDPGPKPLVVGVAFVALLAGVWFLVFRAVVARTTRRLRRLLVARVTAWAAAAAVGAGLGLPWMLGSGVLFVAALVPEGGDGRGLRWVCLALHFVGWGLVVFALGWT